MSSILTLQKQNILGLISTMSQSTGFNSDWTTINQKNYALGSFPRAEVYRIAEKNLDTLGGISSRDYTNRVTYKIHVADKLTFSSDNPIFDIEELFAQDLDDLKALFGANGQLNGTCDNFLYVGFEHEYEAKDQFIPTRLITEWSCTYAQDRLQPSLYASS
jgi:hypothetical protein